MAQQNISTLPYSGNIQRQHGINDMISIQYMDSPCSIPIDNISLPQSSTTESNNNTSLPKWVTGVSQDFATEMLIGSTGLTDKTNNGHKFQWLYQPNLSRLIKQKLSNPDKSSIKKIKD